jgi:hypothetical protein
VRDKTPEVPELEVNPGRLYVCVCVRVLQFRTTRFLVESPLVLRDLLLNIVLFWDEITLFCRYIIFGNQLPSHETSK